MPHVTIESDAVQIRLSTLDKVWAIHGSLQIPLAHVTLARVEDENGWTHMWRKLAGTSAPSLKMAGTFFMPGGLAFLDYGDGKHCLVLETNHENYQQIIVQLGGDQDADQIASEINRRSGSPSG